MTELDAALVRRKLTVIRRNLDDLSALEHLSLAQYRENRFRLKGTERLLQETVEAAVDANLHLLRAAGAATPGDYYMSFVELGRAGILAEELAARLAPSAGLRNRLVHEYDDIDDAIVLAAVRDARRDYADYIGALEHHLASQGL
jgi:uncharacterized protein YutE (UPF0331/DUF86 family)